MATELCKHIINKGTDPLSRVDGSVMFECLTSISRPIPPWRAQEARSWLKDFIFFVNRVICGGTSILKEHMLFFYSLGKTEI